MIPALLTAALLLLVFGNSVIAYAAWKVTRFLNEPEDAKAPSPEEKEPPMDRPKSEIAILNDDGTITRYDSNSKPSRASMAGLRAQVAMATTPEQEKEERIARRNG